MTGAVWLVYLCIAIIGVVLWIVGISVYQISRHRYPGWLEGQLFDNVFAGVFRTTIDGRILMANSAFLNLIGAKSLEEIASVSAWDLYRNPNDRSSTIEEVNEKGTAVRYGVAFVRLDGREIWVDLHFKGKKDRNGNLAILQGILVDATGRKQVEERLRESEWRYRQLAELSQDGIFIFDGNRFVYSNTNLNKFAGREEVAGLTLDDLFDERQKKSIAHFYFSGKKSGTVPELFEVKIVWPDGSVHYGEVACATYRVGENFYVQGSVRDITQRRRMERDLFMQATLLNNAGETAIVSDEKGKVRYINRTGTYFTGYEPEEIVGKPVSMLVLKEDIPVLVKMRERLAANGRDEEEIRLISRNGQVYTCEITAVKVTGMEGETDLYMSLIRDLGPLKQAMKALADANLYMEELNRRLSQNQEEAHQLLEMQFPVEPLVTPRFTVEQAHHMSSTVGGDIVGYQLDGPGLISFFLIDASGHGLSSAMESCNARKLLMSPELAPYRYQPEEMLLVFDRLFKENRFFPEDYVAIIYGFIDETMGVIKYATMGIHNQPILLGSGQEPVFMPSGGLPSFGNLEPRVVGYQLPLMPGQRLVIYSDGFLEATSANGEQFGYERLAKCLNRLSSCTIKGMMEELLNELSGFTGQPMPEDDCSLLVVSARVFPKGQLVSSFNMDIAPIEIDKVPDMSQRIAREVSDKWATEVEGERHQILLLELITNALIHGCLGIHRGKEETGFEMRLLAALGEEKAVQNKARIEVKIFENAVDYVVMDPGEGYNTDLFELRLKDEEDLTSGSLGLKMIKLLADEIEVKPPGNQTRVTVYRR